MASTSDGKKREKGNESRWKMNLRDIYNALISILIKKDSTTTQGPYQPKKERKIGGLEEKFRKLVIVGTGGEKHTSHQKKVEKLRKLIAMRMARKKKVDELMTKREGTFLQKTTRL